MCRNAGLLVGWDYAARRALVTDANCDSWTCDECRERLASRWILRAQIGVRVYLEQGRKIDFVTVTGHERLATWEATERVWRRAWPSLYAALKRKDPDLQYFLVPEKHKSGRMHVHALWTANVTRRWLKDNARSRGLGYECDVQHVDGAASAARYVTKYVGKSLGNDVEKRFKRVRVSQGWPDVPSPNTALSGLKWEYLAEFSAVAAVIRECQVKNYDMIDIRTGQVFETVDLPEFLQPIDT